MSNPRPIVEMRDIVKRFPGIVANDQVTFAAESGEIHGLLGENGAGKTTLMNILYGLYRQDAGEVVLQGRPVQIDSPKHALQLGIGMVHQHFHLIPRLSVLENIILGLHEDPMPPASESDPRQNSVAQRAWRFLVGVDRTRAEAEIRALSRDYQLKIDPHAKIWELSVGEQQRVEIIKALYRQASILILDEPTAVLTPQEVDSLFAMLRTIVDKGHTIIFITHKLNEVMDVCQRITVLRQGKAVATIKSAECDTTSLARMMVGREVLFQVEKPPHEPGEVMLSVEHLRILNDKGLPAVQDASFTVHAGEILGLAGVSGNGQRELVDAINGLRPVESGRVRVAGQDVTNAAPAAIIEAGVGYIPEDRLHVGLATGLPVADNLLLKNQQHEAFTSGWFLDARKLRAHAEELVDHFDVRAPSLDIPVGRLSGGNIQKLILAREIARQPKLLIAGQPTRGLDVGAIEYVQTMLLQQREQGRAILLISENLDETMHLSDRIAVIYEGRIMAIVSPQEVSRREIGLMMAGAGKADT